MTATASARTRWIERRRQDARTNAIGMASLAAFVCCIPLANWLIGHVGTTCAANGPCLVPVLPGVMAPSGVLAAGAALVLRDMAQRCLSARAGIVAIAIGSIASLLLADASLAIASAAAFAAGETTEFLVFTPLQRWHLVLAVAASATAGLVVDSVAFLALAFHSLEFLPGQMAGKAWAVAAGLPVVAWLRRALPTPDGVGP